MAYNKDDLEKQSLEAITKHNLFFINDLVAYLPCSSSTFYDLGLEKSENIKAALEKNRINTKNGLRSKWYKSDNATMTVALYKLLADDIERKKLSQTYTDHTTDGEKIIPILGGTSVHRDDSDSETQEPSQEG